MHYCAVHPNLNQPGTSMLSTAIRFCIATALVHLSALTLAKGEVEVAVYAAIIVPAVDFIEAWYEGDVARMERAVHPDLAKRIPRIDRLTGRTRLHHMSASQLLQFTSAGGGNRIPVEKRQKDILILDAHATIAVVKVVSAEYVDYLQVAKIDGRWVFVNVLWNRKDVP